MSVIMVVIGVVVLLFGLIAPEKRRNKFILTAIGVSMAVIGWVFRESLERMFQ